MLVLLLAVAGLACLRDVVGVRVTAHKPGSWAKLAAGAPVTASAPVVAPVSSAPQPEGSSVTPQVTHKWNGGKIARAAGTGEQDASSPSVSSPQIPAGTKKVLSIVTWNVQDVQHICPTYISNAKHQAHIAYFQSTLASYAAEKSPSIIVLQEIQDCSLTKLDEAEYSCIESTVDQQYEEKLQDVTLGTVILYRRDSFTASNGGRVLNTNIGNVDDWEDLASKSLSDHHAEDCTWTGLSGGRGCSNMQSDMPEFGSVLLTLRPGAWHESVEKALPHGVRVVNVHLYSGARVKTVTDGDKAKRRAFQLRSMVATVETWNHGQGRQGRAKREIVEVVVHLERAESCKKEVRIFKR